MGGRGDRGGRSTLWLKKMLQLVGEEGYIEGATANFEGETDNPQKNEEFLKYFAQNAAFTRCLRDVHMFYQFTCLPVHISMIDRSPYSWPARAGILRACGCCSRTRLLTSWKWLIKWRRGSYVDQISRRVLFDKLRHRFDRDRLYEMVYPNTNAESHDTFLLVNALTMYGLMYPNDFTQCIRLPSDSSTPTGMTC
jgi:hypothetical protein